MIKKLFSKDAQDIYRIVNEAARAYQGVIPDDCYHEPYMPKEELQSEMKIITFFGWEEDDKLVGVMGFQPTKDVILIRHAYVLPDYQGKDIGTNLLRQLKKMTDTRQLLVGTWAKAHWAIDFYQKRGFKLMPNKDELLMKYWNISSRQVETSVVLSMEM